ncbi:MAG: ABC transporter ATP-binding protein [Acidimicrobiales bacterium]
MSPTHKAKPSAHKAKPPSPTPAPAKKVRAKTGPAPALEAIGVEKRYGDLVALAPLELSISDAQAVVLIGHNGSGKTTLLRMAAGLLEPTEGSLEVYGQPAGSLGARAALSYISDQPTFYDDLSVWEHLEYTARLHDMDDWEQRAADLLGVVGLYERADDLPNTFSRGLRQKASIAIGLLRPFRLLLVDEPFVGLDASGKAALIELLDEAREQGAALLVATHDLEFVSRVDRCLALRDGALVHDGSLGDIDVLDLVT